MHTRWTILIPLLLATVLIIAGCSTAAGSQEEDKPAVDPPAADTSDGGTIIIESETIPPAQAGAFQFTGVPPGTVSSGTTLIVSDLEPGTYTSTEVNPAPDFEVTAIDCDDSASATPSSGDPGARSAVVNLDPGETVRCIFTNTRAGTIVLASQTIPDGSAGTFQFTGVPSGTVPSGSTLVVSNLEPGTYTSTEVNPAPDFEVTAIDCDDGASATPSSGDPGTRSAVFNLDPGEMVTCTFTNTRAGTIVLASQTIPDGSAGTFQFTGVPSGTVPSGGTLVVSNLEPGTYTSTEVNPAPDFEVTAIDCDDSASATPSSGDPGTRSANFNLDPGEMVTCTFTNTELRSVVTSTATAGGITGCGTSSAEGGNSNDDSSNGGTNPFDDPGNDLADFPLPEELPPGAGTFASPKPGPWSATNFEGQMACGDVSLSIPASPPESGVLEVLEGGRTLIGTGLQDDQTASITLNADPSITGRYTGSFQGTEQGVPVTINYFWQVVTDEYIVGFLTASVTAEGRTCSVYRPYELVYTGR